MSFVIGFVSLSFYTGIMDNYDNSVLTNQTYTARETWLQCINDIQDHTMKSLSDVFSRDELHSSSNPPLLYIDPNYKGNAGDNFIVYGTLIFIEKMGFLEHTECHVYASQNLVQNCGDFSQFGDGGIAIWQGGGHWGDLYGYQIRSKKRFQSIVTFANKKKVLIGFPNSLHYKNTNLQAQDAEMLMGNLSHLDPGDLKKNIILSWRQENSFSLAKDLYPLVGNRYHENIILEFIIIEICLDLFLT